MKKLIAAGLLLIPGCLWAADAQLKTDDDKTFYALGALMGQGLDVFNLSQSEFAMLQKGLSDSINKKKYAVELDEYKPKIEAVAEKRTLAAAEIEKKKAKEYIDKALKEKGAVKLASGVVFIETKPGVGDAPKSNDTVKVHYHGTLIDGKVFDSSVKRGQPAVFPLDGVIPCWTEGLQKIKVGGKAKLICPSETAYGDMGRRPQIPGGAALVFEVELIEIVKEDKAAKQGK